jgi:deoxycytidylate deaminase
MIINANIKEIVTRKPYPDRLAQLMLKEARIKVRFLRAR